MAKGRYFSEFEQDVIRAGVATGHNYVQIARFLRRHPSGVQQQANKMKKAGTLDNLPFGFLVDDLDEQIGGKADG